ncbi:MAG: hypothetical protein OXR72_15745 [Gemmatimonadota bacterium]|nr:hypothetical protein [Gemmatimonadota bacterium]
MKRQDIIKQRRQFKAEGFATLTDVGMDGNWVTPIQKLSHSEDGPVIVAYYWWDAESVLRNREELRKFGYAPRLKFNKVIDLAIGQVGITRKELYITQAFHLLPLNGTYIPQELIRRSFNLITQYEIYGRNVIALGNRAQQVCAYAQVDYIPCVHPDARGRTIVSLAAELAKALRKFY